MIYLNEYGCCVCIKCKNIMTTMDDDVDNWWICERCSFICYPIHFVKNSCMSGEEWEYIIPIFKTNYTIKHVTVKNCFDWFWIEEDVEKFICSCGKKCEADEQMPCKYPFIIEEKHLNLDP